MFTIISITIFVLVGIGGLILTVRNKRRMEKGLGRKVDRLQANSISNWIEIEEKNETSKS